MQTEDVLSVITQSEKSSNAQNLIVVVKDGLSSREFTKNAKSFEYLKSKVIENGNLFTNLR
jgi:hypothetical protein